MLIAPASVQAVLLDEDIYDEMQSPEPNIKNIIAWINENKENKNAVSEDKATVLMDALKLGVKPVIDHLIKVGADTLAKDEHRENALDRLITSLHLNLSEKQDVAHKLLPLMIKQSASVNAVKQQVQAVEKFLMDEYAKADKLSQDITVAPGYRVQWMEITKRISNDQLPILNTINREIQKLEKEKGQHMQPIKPAAIPLKAVPLQKVPSKK